MITRPFLLVRRQYDRNKGEYTGFKKLKSWDN